MLAPKSFDQGGLGDDGLPGGQVVAEDLDEEVSAGEHPAVRAWSPVHAPGSLPKAVSHVSDEAVGVPVDIDAVPAPILIRFLVLDLGNRHAVDLSLSPLVSRRAAVFGGYRLDGGGLVRRHRELGFRGLREPGLRGGSAA